MPSLKTHSRKLSLPLFKKSVCPFAKTDLIVMFSSYKRGGVKREEKGEGGRGGI